MHNIICLETEWLFNNKKNNQFNLDTKSILNCIENFYGCNIIHRSILSKDNLQYYMNFFVNHKQKFNKYNIIYFACHGWNHSLSLEGNGGEEYDLEELADTSNGFFKNKIVHFSSCRTLSNENAALTFKEKTGARLISGYKISVDPMKSTIADMAYLNDLMQIKNVGIILNEERSRFWKTYESLLEELNFVIL